MTLESQAVGIIPARWESTRFPGKPLALLAGRPMIQWVVEAALQANQLSEVIVATDDSRIVDAVTAFGGRAVMTSPDHATGSDRIAEVAQQGDWDIVVNIQGDEPLIRPEEIDKVVVGLKDNPDVPVSTLKTRIRSWDEVDDPNAVKVVTDKKGRALYFSREPIPHDRERAQEGPGDTPIEIKMYRHLGIYGYRKSFLLEFTHMVPTPLEQLESLEQLRILETGNSILVLETEQHSPGVDCPEDLEKVEQLIKEKH